MVWFFERDSESLRLETRYHNGTNEFVAVVHWVSAPKQIERFPDATEFRAWLAAFEEGLAKERWRTTRSPGSCPMAGPARPTKKPQ